MLDIAAETLPRVSVMMLTYNHAKFIAQAIESILSQKADFQYDIQLGDDFSTDGTREICLRYANQNPDKIVMHSSDRNLGVMKNAHRLHRACRGEYLAICEGDDYWTDTTKLQKQVHALDAHPDWSGCFHKTRVHDENGLIPDSFLPKSDPPWAVELGEIAAENCIANCSIMYRRKLIPEWPDWFSSLTLGDWPLHILHAAQGPLGYLNDEMAVYRRHSEGVWSTLKYEVGVDHSLRALFALESHTEEPTRSIIVSGRREFLRRLIHNDELVRLRKIESRYRALQLHRLAAIGKWFKQLIGR